MFTVRAKMIFYCVRTYGRTFHKLYRYFSLASENCDRNMWTLCASISISLYINTAGRTWAVVARRWRRLVTVAGTDAARRLVVQHIVLRATFFPLSPSYCISRIFALITLSGFPEFSSSRTNNRRQYFFV